MKAALSFYIDKLTKSIQEVSTGKTFTTEVIPVLKEELKTISKKNGWKFNWRNEYRKPNRSLYKLVIKDSLEIQGLISIEPIPDDLYIEMHLIESAPHNFGKHKAFDGVPGNLVAFACKKSFDLKFDGMVAFTAKTKLMSHYQQKLGAVPLLGQQRMGIYSTAARKLVSLYFSNYFL